MDYLLDHEDVAGKMGENGFRYVMENFTHEVIRRKYLGFIEMCLH